MRPAAPLTDISRRPNQTRFESLWEETSVTANPLAIGFVAFLVASLRRTKSTPPVDKSKKLLVGTSPRLSSKGLAVTGGRVVTNELAFSALPDFLLRLEHLLKLNITSHEYM